MKLKSLIEYYKYHTEIPRIFLYPVSKIFNKYHDKKREIKYAKVTKQLLREEKIKNGHDPLKEQSQNHRSLLKTEDRVLASLLLEDEKAELSSNFNSNSKKHIKILT